MTQYAFVTLEACRFFQIYGPPPAEWFDSLLPSLLPLPSFRMGDGSVIVWTPNEAMAVNESSCAAFALTDSGLFEGLAAARKVEAFNRVLRLIQANVDQSTSIPSLWRSFNSDSLISIQSSPRAKGERARVLFDRKKFAKIIGCFRWNLWQSIHEVDIIIDDTVRNANNFRKLLAIKQNSCPLALSTRTRLDAN